MPFETKTFSTGLVVVWDRPVLEDIRAIVDLVGTLRRRLGKPLTYVAYIPDAAATPEGSVRNAMTRSMDDLLENCETVVFVLEGSGFRMSIGRAALAGIMLASGNRGRVHIAASIEEAATWLAPEYVTYLQRIRASKAREE